MKRFQHQEGVFWEEKQYSGGVKNPAGKVGGHRIEVYTIPVDIVNQMMPPMTQHFIIERAVSIDEAFKLLPEAENSLQKQLSNPIIVPNGAMPKM